jgi:hypothetical protein
MAVVSVRAFPQLRLILAALPEMARPDSAQPEPVLPNREPVLPDSELALPDAAELRTRSARPFD